MYADLSLPAYQQKEHRISDALFAMMFAPDGANDVAFGNDVR